MQTSKKEKLDNKKQSKKQETLFKRIILREDQAVQLEKRVNCYAVKCQNGKYYVGQSQNLDYRVQQHLSGTFGSAWTRKNKGIFLIEKRLNASPFQQDKMTKQYMQKYGIMNVRGGAYSLPSDILPQEQTKILQSERWHAQGKCMYCGDKDHWISNCPFRLRDIKLKTIKKSINNEKNQLEIMEQQLKSEQNAQVVQELTLKIKRLQDQIKKRNQQLKETKVLYIDRGASYMYYDSESDEYYSQQEEQSSSQSQQESSLQQPSEDDGQLEEQQNSSSQSQPQHQEQSVQLGDDLSEHSEQSQEEQQSCDFQNQSYGSDS